MEPLFLRSFYIPSPPLITAAGIKPISTIMLVLAVLFVSGRLYSNISLHRRLRLDDLACIFSAILFLGYTGILLAVDYFSWSTLQSEAALTSFDLKAFYALETIAGPANFFAKSAVLLLYLHVFSTKNTFRYCVYAGLIFAFVLQWLDVPVYAGFCASHNGTWGDSVATSCERTFVFAVVQTTLDVVLNLYILLLPIPSILALQLSMKRKLGIIFILMHGIFALVASIVCLHCRVSVLQQPEDVYHRTSAFVCVMIEISMTIVSSSFHPCVAYFRSTKEKSHKLRGESSYLSGAGRSSRNAALPSSGSDDRPGATGSPRFVLQSKSTEALKSANSCIRVDSEIVVTDVELQGSYAPHDAWD